MPEPTAREGYACALRLLGRRAFSVQEMTGKLQRRGFPEAVAQEVVGRLRQEGWLDDAAYAQAYVHDRLRFNPAGRRVLRAELLRRGVTGEAAEAAVSELDAEAEVQLVSELAAKRLRQRASRREEVERLRRWLLGRGFSYAAVARVLGSLPSDDEPWRAEDETPDYQ